LSDRVRPKGAAAKRKGRMRMQGGVCMPGSNKAPGGSLFSLPDRLVGL
jgi:hypothetical protein